MKRHLHIAAADIVATCLGGVIGLAVALSILNELARRHQGAR